MKEIKGPTLKKVKGGTGGTGDQGGQPRAFAAPIPDYLLRKSNDTKTP
ncbi:hypothetical protein [Pseudoalteromonas sp. Of7M-16]|nr:hypothetical protein [Pseudoalteromonas sp. Of7M-16]MCG7551592.1 hypothetical protein [Pseudoalteromonas sp. Of7M-16]